MPSQISPSACATEDHVRQLAQRMCRVSEALHRRLRQANDGEWKSDSTAVYALLTEEYALRARANILMIEGKRFARPDFPTTQQDVLTVLDDVEAALVTTWSPQALTDLMVALMLFANSIASRNNEIISLLLKDLKKQTDEHAR
jgi:hypothetical protein